MGEQDEGTPHSFPPQRALGQEYPKIWKRRSSLVSPLFEKLAGMVQRFLLQSKTGRSSDQIYTLPLAHKLDRWTWSKYILDFVLLHSSISHVFAALEFFPCSKSGNVAC
jgi:hypothetical protein